MSRAPETVDQPPPRWTRWFVAAFLTVFVVSGLAGIEAWPFTGFRLFSHLRHESVTTWHAAVVDGSGNRTRVRFADLPAAYGGASLLMEKFDSISTSQQDAACRSWLRAARASGLGGAVRLDVERFDRHLLPRRNGRAAGSVVVTIVYSCRLEPGGSP